MFFDIYGNYLKLGHCEVHPMVAEEYPCFVCLRESNNRKEALARQSEYYQEMMLADRLAEERLDKKIEELNEEIG